VLTILYFFLVYGLLLSAILVQVRTLKLIDICINFTRYSQTRMTATVLMISPCCDGIVHAHSVVTRIFAIYHYGRLGQLANEVETRLHRTVYLLTVGVSNDVHEHYPRRSIHRK
jgi:TctA family transporter